MKKDFIFGMNVHNKGYQSYPDKNLDFMLDECEQMHQNLIRFNFVPRTNEDYRYIETVIDKIHSRGMKIMLCVDSLDTLRVPMEEIPDAAYNYYYGLSSRLGTKVDIYQLYNELCVWGMHNDIGNIVNCGSDGKDVIDYDPSRFERAVIGVKAATEGLKAGCSDAVSCVNVSWWHTALIYEICRNGALIDVIGLDWYSDCEAGSSIEQLLDELTVKLAGRDFMFCETNYWMHPHPKFSDEQNARVFIDEKRNCAQAEWVSAYTKRAYGLTEKYPAFKGIIHYELMDEPAFEKHDGKYNGESHFGFIACDANGNDPVRKPAFYALKEAIEELNG